MLFRVQRSCWLHIGPNESSSISWFSQKLNYKTLHSPFKQRLLVNLFNNYQVIKRPIKSASALLLVNTQNKLSQTSCGEKCFKQLMHLWCTVLHSESVKSPSAMYFSAAADVHPHTPYLLSSSELDVSAGWHPMGDIWSTIITFHLFASLWYRHTKSTHNYTNFDWGHFQWCFRGKRAKSMGFGKKKK